MSRSIELAVFRALRPWAGAALCVAGWAVPAIAQQTGATPGASPNNAATAATDTSLAEIVVTAQFRKQNLQDTPIAITAVNAAMMEERGQTSLHDLGNEAPNVTLVETGGAFGPGMTASIRGIGQGDFDPALSPGVGIYIDDVYYTSLTGSNFALLDLDRVEILRGPQGTLAGANSEGGAIKLYTVKPQGDDTGAVKVSGGERSLIDVQAMADVSLIKDTLVHANFGCVASTRRLRDADRLWLPISGRRHPGDQRRRSRVRVGPRRRPGLSRWTHRVTSSRY